MSTRPEPAARQSGLLERLVLALTFVVLAGFFPWFEPLHSPNELTRVYLASALVEDGTVSIDGPVKRWGPIFDASVRDGKTYSDKAPGTAFLAAPAVALYDALASEPTLAGKVRVTRLVVSTLPTLLLLVLMLAFLREHIADRGLRLALVTAYALGTVATAYAGLLFGHQLSAVVLFGLFLQLRRLTAPRPPPWRLVAIGLTTALAVWVEYQNVLLLMPLAGYFVWRMRTRGLVRALAFAALGALPLVAVLLAYHQAAFGSPWLTGYSFIASSFKEVHKQGLLGVALPKPAHAWLSFLSPGKGLFFFAPWLALAVPGLVLAWRHAGSDGRVAVLVVVLYALFVSALVYPVGGWTMSQRHLVPMVPFLVLPVGLLLQRVAATRVLFAGLAVASIAICTTSWVVWPHYQEHLENPFFQLGWPLFRDRFVSPSVFGALGISARSAIIVLEAAAMTLVVWGALGSLVRHLPGRAWRLGALAASLAIAAYYLACASIPGRAQDVRGDLKWVASVYSRDDATK